MQTTTADFFIWLITQSQRLGIEQKLTVFPESPELFHYTIKSFQYDPVVSGHACSTKVGEAKLKACVEFLERLNLRLCFPGNVSIGFACHFDPLLARQSAYNELLERDSFLWHWHWDVAPEHLNSESSESRSISFYRLQSRDPSLFVILCLLKIDEGPYLIGLGSHPEFARAQEKSRLEVMAGFYNYLINTPQPMNLADFRLIKRFIPLHHFELSLSLEYTEIITRWLTLKNSATIPSLKTVHLAECPWDESLQGHHLKMFRATSDDLIKFYFGLPDLMDAPNQLPHPVA